MSDGSPASSRNVQRTQFSRRPVAIRSYKRDRLNSLNATRLLTRYRLAQTGRGVVTPS
jgi:hypothetical protein